MDALSLEGVFKTQIIRDGRVVFKQSFNNGIVQTGYNNILDVMFGSASKPSWYCGLIETITTLSTYDTMASHSGWSEYTSYDEATREIWTPSAASNKLIENIAANYIEFTVNDATPPTLDGIFICDNNTKGGTTGVLWSTAAFTNPPTPVDDDIIQVQYIVKAY